MSLRNARYNDKVETQLSFRTRLGFNKKLWLGGMGVHIHVCHSSLSDVLPSHLRPTGVVTEIFFSSNGYKNFIKILLQTLFLYPKE